MAVYVEGPRAVSTQTDSALDAVHEVPVNHLWDKFAPAIVHSERPISDGCPIQN